MATLETVAPQGSSRGVLPPLLLVFLFYTTISGRPAHAADGQTACRSAFARIVSIQGTVEVLRSDSNDWARVTQLDSSICPGERLRTGPQSRAALYLQPETLVRVDQNTSVTFSQTAGETLVEFVQEEVAPVSASAHACGAGYFVTRFPRKFRVKTPHLNAAIEGTEFLVAMRCESTELSVFEGKVLATSAGVNTFPSQSVVSGQTLTVGASEPPVIKLLIKPSDAVQWTLYYPPITPADAAVVENCLGVAPDDRAACSIAQVERLLRAGRVDEAQANIGDALANAPYSSDAKALSSVISLVRNDKAEALRLAREAVHASPNSAPAWLALSYVQQAEFTLEAALTSAKRASELTPSSALGLARVAELQLSLGWTGEAEKTARQAVAANRSESRAQMILGFVHLAQIKAKEARENFGRAIESDSTDPLSRLGLGLAIIREGKLVEGREQIEIAVALDPTNSLIRSYVGKAYYEENTKERDQLAYIQFGLAKQFDPNDPTSWFYESILRLSQNQPVEALQELHLSIEKNDNRVVSRSRLLLDDDAAARNASLANLYRELGFEQLAVVESAKALDDNFGNSSAHRLLADSYFNYPKYAIARVSEALQSQIREPLSFPGMDPQLSSDNLAILRDTGPSRPGASEFGFLFNRNQIRFQGEGITGNKATNGEELVIGGLAETSAFAMSQLHYETHGFGENDAATKNIQDLFIHGQVSSDTSAQLDVKHTDLRLGQTFFAFDPTFLNPTTISEDSDSFRVSGRHLVDSTADWIWSTIYEDRTRTVQGTPDIGLLEESLAATTTAELQYLKKFSNVQIVSGIGYIEQKEHFPLEGIDIHTSSANLYVYGQWRPAGPAFSIHFGLAEENFRQDNSFFSNNIERHEISPKLGLVWSPHPGTTLRAAAFSSVRRPFIASQTIEPTQVAGFNQFFTGFEAFYGDIDGTISRSAGVALDQAFSKSAFAGIETTYRELRVPSIVLVSDFTWRETTARAYLYKIFGANSDSSIVSSWHAAASLECAYEHITRPQVLTGAEGIMELNTIKIPISVRFLAPQWPSLRLATTYVRQTGLFSVDEGFPTFSTKDQAWITDLSIDYHLLRRQGAFSVGVKNLFDSKINLVESDPLNRQIVLGRFFFAKAQLAF